MRNCLCAIVINLVLARLPAGAQIVHFSNAGEAFDIEFVTVTAPGNVPDDADRKGLSHGAVDYVYQIAKFETSRFDYAVHTGAAERLPANMSALPKTGSWEPLAAFVNFLNEVSGIAPAYNLRKLDGGVVQARPWAEFDDGYDPYNPWRNSKAVYVIPTADEWHKAAYFDPSTGQYFDYGNASDVLPKGVSIPTVVQDEVIYSHIGPAVVDVRRSGGLSPWGTMGQTGNAAEWEEGLYQEGFHALRAGGQYATEDQRADRSRMFPLTSAGLRVVRLFPDSPGDYDRDGTLSALDMDLLSLNVLNHTEDILYDVNGDQTLGENDRLAWVEQVAGTFLGDANLDGTVGFDDFLSLSAGFDSPGGWASGDFDGSGEVGFSDFLILSSNYGSGTEAAAVPEPNSQVALGIGAVLLLNYRRRWKSVA